MDFIILLNSVSDVKLFNLIPLICGQLEHHVYDQYAWQQ